MLKRANPKSYKSFVLVSFFNNVKKANPLYILSG